MSNPQGEQPGLFGRIRNLFSPDNSGAETSTEAEAEADTSSTESELPALNIRRIPGEGTARGSQTRRQSTQTDSDSIQTAESTPTESSPATPTPESLLQMAARCYANAGWVEDASRLLEEIGDLSQAALYYEQQNLWEKAAACYCQVEQWQPAARCYSQAENWSAAADCWLEAGDLPRAAWLYADRAHDYSRSEALLQDYSPTSTTERLRIDLVRVRCQIGQSQEEAGVQRLQAVLREISSTGAILELTTWAGTIAEFLDRPDLRATTHALAVTAGLPHAQSQWEQWATSRLGDATGVPSINQSRASYDSTSQVGQRGIDEADTVDRTRETPAQRLKRLMDEKRREREEQSNK